MNQVVPRATYLSMNDAAERLYERVLVIRCQGGDPSALAELITRYSRQLRFFLKKIAGEAADDLLQDVWIEVFAKVARLRDPQAFPEWMYQIARAKAYSHLARRQPVELATINEVPCDPVEEVWTADDAESIHAGLNQIEVEHREVLLLRFIEDMSYEQIAVVIGCPLGTVRSRLHYAKRALRKVIENASR